MDGFETTLGVVAYSALNVWLCHVWLLSLECTMSSERVIVGVPLDSLSDWVLPPDRCQAVVTDCMIGP